MIKNVIVDLGNVMVTFYPDIYISQFVHKKGEVDYFNHICFRSPEWFAGDTNAMSREETIAALCKKYPADVEMIHTLMDHCDDMLRPSKTNTALLKKLHEAGVGVYFLSNTNAHAFEMMSSTFEMFQYMDGGIASYQHGMTKPGQEIFKRFLKLYDKKAEECVFVDDTPANAEAAASVGYHAIILKNIDDLADELSKFEELAKIINA